MNIRRFATGLGAMILAASSAMAQDAQPTLEEMWAVIQQQQAEIARLKEQVASADAEIKETSVKVDATANMVEESVASGGHTLASSWAEKTTIGSYGEMHYNNLDNQNGDIDQRPYITQGPVLIDLTSLDSNTTIIPRESGRMLFSIKSRDSLRLYSDWDDFVNDLNASLDGATSARSMHAYGQYDANSNTFTAYKLGIFLLEP